MAISSANAAAAPKVRKVETLNSGTSWTVPANVEFVNATLIGGGGGGGGGDNTQNFKGENGLGGQIITTTVTTTPGASISYSIGAGGIAGQLLTKGGTGGTTTFTGATSALGGYGGLFAGGNNTGQEGRQGLIASNEGQGGYQNAIGGAGGAGQIIIEYWV